MSDLRLVVTGAAGRMGRMLVQTIPETLGVRLTGALENPASAMLGKDFGRDGRRRGERRADFRRSRHSPRRLRCAHRLLDARCERGALPAGGRGRRRPCHWHDGALGRGPRGYSGERAKNGGGSLRQYEPRGESACGAGGARRTDARSGLGRGDRRNAPPDEGRRPLGDGAAAGRSGRAGAWRQSFRLQRSAGATGSRGRASRAILVSRACAAARLWAITA